MHASKVRTIALATVVLFATGTHAQSESGGCSGLKLRATGGAMAHGLSCWSKATRGDRPLSGLCLAAGSTKLRRAFQRAERKGGCATSGDVALIGSSVDSFVAGMAATLVPDVNEAAVRRCAARKLTATGTKGFRDLRCAAKAISQGVAIDSACVTAAHDSFVEAFEAAEAKGGCATSDDAAAIGGAIDAFTAAVLSVLAPDTSVGTTTTTTSATNTSDTTTTTGSGGTTTTGSGGTTTTTTLAGGVVSFATNVQPIFTANCATASCHGGPMPQKGLDLTSGHAYASLVNVGSQECPLFKRVVPGQPGASYLMFKIVGPPQPCFSGNQMPSGGALPLSTTDQSLIAAWITQGAQSN